MSGSVLAFWLAKHNPSFNITVIERSRIDQKLGQGIEIEEPALSVVRAMGIMPQLYNVRTGEEGFQLVDERGRSSGYIGMDFENSPTGALEMMRGDLTQVLYKAAEAFHNVTYKYETTATAMSETKDGKIKVDVRRRGEDASMTEQYDLVVGADGVRSRTREMAMGDSPDWHKPVDAFVSYFSIPREGRDYPNSKLCHFPGRRVVWLRPVGKDSKHTSVYLIVVGKDIPALREANQAGDRMKQKKIFAEHFSDCGWETKRVIDQMMEANNFYSDELVQVHLPAWSKGRFALVGDSAWAPTPFTGQGNQLAILGAWVLAQEITRNPTPEAFTKYEKRLRAYVEDCQQIPLYGYAPRLAAPDTNWGIWIFRTIFVMIAWFAKVTASKKPALSLEERLEKPGKIEKPFDLEMEGEDLEASQSTRRTA